MPNSISRIHRVKVFDCVNPRIEGLDELVRLGTLGRGLDQDLCICSPNELFRDTWLS